MVPSSFGRETEMSKNEEDLGKHYPLERSDQPAAGEGPGDQSQLESLESRTIISDQGKRKTKALKKGDASGVTGSHGNPFKEHPGLQEEVEAANAAPVKKPGMGTAATAYLPGAGQVVIDFDRMLEQAQEKADPIRTSDGQIRPNLVAYDMRTSSEAKTLYGSLEEKNDISGPEEREAKRVAGYADQNGEVPFGEPVKPGFGAGKQSNSSYYVLTVGVEGTVSGSVAHTDVININIGDKLKIGGSSILDGQPHRHQFPIKSGPGNTHWHWADATVAKDSSGQVSVFIHRLSPSRGDAPPESANDWDDVNVGWRLKHQQLPQHANAEDYKRLVMSNHLVRPNEPQWYQNGGYSAPVVLTERARSDD